MIALWKSALAGLLCIDVTSASLREPLTLMGWVRKDVRLLPLVSAFYTSLWSARFQARRLDAGAHLDLREGEGRLALVFSSWRACVRDGVWQAVHLQERTVRWWQSAFGWSRS